MSIINTSPLYKDKDIVLDSTGNISMSYNDISSEILQRLTSIRSTAPFLKDYGSKISELQNKRLSSNINGEAYSIVKESLQPMITNVRIKDDLVVNVILNGNLLNIVVRTISTIGGIVTANYSKFLE